ncbi:MAG: DinB family protein [Dehalococcoidales bacterium]|nr:DinB family protein [Dehalococcoidales bacterium]
MDAVKLATTGLRVAYESLEQVMGDVTPEQAFWMPPGVANPIGALYLHTLYDTDAVIQRMFQSKPPLWETGGWAQKIGTDVDMDLTAEWARSVRFDLDAAREYAKAVYVAADYYVCSLGEKDFDVIIPSGTSDQTTLGHLLQSYIIWHIDVHCGEISALKGIQGLKGYPF